MISSTKLCMTISGLGSGSSCCCRDCCCSGGRCGCQDGLGVGGGLEVPVYGNGRDGSGYLPRISLARLVMISVGAPASELLSGSLAVDVDDGGSQWGSNRNLHADDKFIMTSVGALLAPSSSLHRRGDDLVFGDLLLLPEPEQLPGVVGADLFMFVLLLYLCLGVAEGDLGGVINCRGVVVKEWVVVGWDETAFVDRRIP
jgi:hypothetical protein